VVKRQDLEDDHSSIFSGEDRKQRVEDVALNGLNYRRTITLLILIRT
jgi:hypothetical protein